MENINDLRLAVLIDADNIPYKNVKAMMEEIARYGTPTFKRIYGDWTKPNLSGWKKVLLENSIIPIQQYGYTTGKNATDSAMIIDAMDILYSGQVQGFCIVSSDSDFTRLASRLREAGMKVYGIGEQKTPMAFISACDKFIYLEILEPPEDEEIEKGKSHGKAGKKTTTKRFTRKLVGNKLPRNIAKLIRTSIADVADENGWAFLGDVGNLIMKKQPDFDPRNFGFMKLTPLIRGVDGIEIDERETSNRHVKHIYIKEK
ncbi:MAG: NYN domain-containing protein [Clostridiales bacterium]|nr:NYN domain-containing protein [Clostridiales bacterium]